MKDLDSAREALADNTKRATDRLRDLQRHIADARDDDRIDGAFANQLLAGVDDVARSYGLKLPPGKGGKG
ncbi:MAG: hypothetical protein IPO81_09350 [Kouleothrix sp.]|nr:hypothetical protein [Kouleothrix sp.]